MMVAEQTQSFMIRFELPVQSGFVGNMKLIISFLCQLRLWSWVCGAWAHESVTSLMNIQSHARERVTTKDYKIEQYKWFKHIYTARWKDTWTRKTKIAI